MNWLNHFIFAVWVCFLLVPPSLTNALLVTSFSLVFGVLIDLDHRFNRRAPWYRKRTWIQEPPALVTVGLPVSLLLSRIDEIFFVLVLVPYASHVLLDYLCVFEASPLAPFSKVKKREGLGVFIPDSFLVKSENSKKWERRVRDKNIKGISENYFTPFNVASLIMVILLKFNLL